MVKQIGRRRGTDLLSDAGYSEGDVLPIFTHTMNDSDAFYTFTDTSYTTYNRIMSLIFQPSELHPNLEELRYSFSALLDPATGDTTSVRVWNWTDSESVVSTSTDTQDDFVTTGWTEYTPTTTDSPIAFVGQAKTSDGTESDSVTGFSFRVGVQL
jgi:hypothetical protein